MVRESVTIADTWYAWRFKLARTPENDERVEEWCYANGSRWIVSAEHGDVSGNEHYQGALLSNVSKFKLHQSIKLDLEVTDREFSCKPCRKPETYFSYLTKEEVLVWYCDTEREAVVEWISKSEYKKTKKCPSKLTFMDRMLADFDSEFLGDVDPLIIYRWVCAYFGKHCKIHDRFIIDRHANVLLARSAPDDRKVQVAHWEKEWASHSDFKYLLPKVYPNASPIEV